MHQQELLPLDADPEVAIGLTSWVDGAPPCPGWWRTRTKRNPSYFQPQRRYWDGKYWSREVFPDDETGAAMQKQVWSSSLGTQDIEWCGLKEAHPDGYEPAQWSYLLKAYPDHPDLAWVADEIKLRTGL